jgi:hypothetical protein
VRQIAGGDVPHGQEVALQVDIDLEENRLTAGEFLCPHREVGAEFLGWQMGGDERLGIEREIEIVFHDDYRGDYLTMSIIARRGKLLADIGKKDNKGGRQHDRRGRRAEAECRGTRRVLAKCPHCSTA